ncbi:hypothetical protein [Cellulosimicrobium cellulans]|uniref:hypothetical protein n=1 Tax=Cellulosimicrobium cellulans TaxID=1710 RepID=UPI00130E845F|nr:hypothetical protein [Cellulosimicrobium cellulans]
MRYRWAGGGLSIALTWDHLVLVPREDPLEMDVAPIHGASSDLLLSMTFRDSGNRWWRRDEHGNLIRVREASPGKWLADDGDGGWVPTTRVLPVNRPG